MPQRKSGTLKSCRTCRKAKPESEFYKNAAKYDGLSSYCKPCTDARVKANRKRVLQSLATRTDAPTTKTCKKCGVEKPVVDFHKDTTQLDGMRSACKACVNTHRREYAKTHPKPKTINYHYSWLKYRYAVSPEQYDALYKAQGGVCAVCGKPEKLPDGRRLAVDHDHITGSVRGLLCGNCNRGIGNFHDDPETIRRALAYVLKHGAERSEGDA